MTRVWLILSLVLVGVAASFGYLFFQRLTQGFPQLPEGQYAGIMVYENEPALLSWFIESRSGPKRLAVAVAAPAIPAQESGIAETAMAGGLPLILVGEGSRLRFSGSKVDENLFEGRFEDPISGRVGRWTLQKVEAPNSGGSMEADLEAWTVLVDELARVEQQIGSAQKKFDLQQSKLEKLSRFIIDEDSLREKANSRYDATSTSISDARAKLSDLRGELDEAARNVELAQRISPRGRLALLAREALQRESRWIEISLNLLAPETSPDFEQALGRASRVKGILDEIAAERSRIADLQYRDRYQGRLSETAVEEEFYREFQR